MNKEESLYGINAVDEGRLLALGKNMLKLQSIKFWVLSYLFSLIIFQFFKLYIPPLDLLNIILFPFSLMLVGDIAIRFPSSFSFLYKLLYPSYENLLDSSSVFRLILIILLKIAIYIMIWKYTFVVGIIGLIIKISQIQKMK